MKHSFESFAESERAVAQIRVTQTDNHDRFVDSWLCPTGATAEEVAVGGADVAVRVGHKCAVWMGGSH